MPIFAIVGAAVGFFIWGGLLAALLKFIFKKADKRLLNGIALAIVIILPTLSLGIDDAFVANLIAAVPVWFLWNYLDRRFSKQAAKPSTEGDDPTTHPTRSESSLPE
jgi:hypothetical protein